MRPLPLALLLALSGCLGGGEGPARPPDETQAPAFGFEALITGLQRPTFLTYAGDSGRLFVTEQPGRVRVVEQGKLVETPYLDLTEKVGSEGNEQGLFSVAFHPQFATNGFLYVSYTDTGGDSVVERYRRSDEDPMKADPDSGKTILKVDQPYPNHNGGLILFGPDDHLWIALGDGGSGGDPHGHAQDKGSLLGKILRIDVDAGDPYGIPDDNPFRADEGARDEIWAYGLRNPWRFSFDRERKDLYIADVGQHEWEEVNFERAGSRGGANYGWNVYEGSHLFRPGSLPDRIDPVAEYNNDGRHCSITGGYVYRGQEIGGLKGKYLLADYCSGSLWTLGRSRGAWILETLEPVDFMISSFAEDARGELYAIDHGGRVLRLVPK